MLNNRDTYFGFNPSVNIKRSKFDMSYRVKTAFNNGKLVPLGEPIEVLPGDTFSVDVNSFIRMNPTVNVPLDDIIADIWFFWVPNRIVWDHWKEFCGENNTDPWTSATTYSVPQLYFNTGTSGTAILPESILSYMGIPTLVNVSPYGSALAFGINILPIRGYCEIWNTFFRDENYQYPILFSKGDTGSSYSTTLSANWQSASYGNELLPLNRFHDLFSSCLPEPQFGDAVRIPLSDSTYWKSVGATTSSLFKLSIGSGTGATPTSGSSSVGNSGVLTLDESSMGTIDALRIAVLAQRYLWQLGNYGHRYVEVIKGFFGVVAPDYMVSRPVLLGTTRFNINISPVVQTSASETTNFDSQTLDQSKGSISGYSASRHDASIFTHSFVEHGFIIPVFGTRTHRSYTSGISKIWTRHNFLDYYNPVFASIGSQPVYTYQIYANGATQTPNNTVFGYNEAWAEYRYINDLTTGLMRANNLYYTWTFSDYYSGRPTYDASWVAEGMTNLNRNLYIQGSSTVPQFLADFYVKVTAVRPMPVHSVPGLSPYL